MSYEAAHGEGMGYGAKAQSVLGLVKGANFTKGKNKMKKNAFYRGGSIDDNQVNSIKFANSDDDE